MSLRHTNEGANGSVWPVTCAWCSQVSYKPVGAVNRAERIGAPLYCNRACSGLARRDQNPPSATEKQAAKAEYDRQRRARLGEELLAKKRAAYRVEVENNLTELRTKQKAHRQSRKAFHAEYCRRPQYREWKAEYDEKYRARKWFGDFGEAAIILNDLCSEIAARSTFTERAIAKGTLNKHTQRRRDYERQTDRR